MPTPFMHLQMAHQLIDIVDGRLRDLLDNHWPAFLLGSIAPDFQVICDIPREATHFYPIPPADGDYAAFDRLQRAYPELARPAALRSDQAVFWIGYGIHLTYDLLWDHRVLTPNFRHAAWGDLVTRFTSHNTLLTYLDRQAYDQLPAGYDRALAESGAAGRLPFDPAAELVRWQEMIVSQLRPGGTVQTVEIYARRMRIPPERFAAQLNDPHWMAANVFCHAPVDLVRETLAEIVPLGKTAAEQYLAPLLAGEIC